MYMSNFSERYKNIVDDIENSISDEKEREYVSKRIHEMSCMFIDFIDRITKLDDARIELIEENQDKIIATLSRLTDSVNLIKNDIYEDDGYDFEIVCPYCNHEFVADIESELREEVECPECHNIIELDWEDEEEKSSNTNHCSGCSGCASRFNHSKEEETSNKKSGRVNNIIDIKTAQEDEEEMDSDINTETEQENNEDYESRDESDEDDDM